MTIPPPGTPVRLTRPKSPGHYRKGLTGTVRESGVYQAVAPRVWLVVDFPDCPHNRKGLPFGSFLWLEEVEILR